MSDKVTAKTIIARTDSEVVNGRIAAAVAEYAESHIARGPQLATVLTSCPESALPDLPVGAPAHEAPLPAPGARIGQYEIIRELGRGGMGAVYAARDTKLGRKVAIKLLSSNNHPELTARFIIEARSSSSARTPRSSRRSRPPLARALRPKRPGGMRKIPSVTSGKAGALRPRLPSGQASLRR